MSILEWPDVLRAAGLEVFERSGWRGNQPLGPLKGLRVIYWHHDASGKGPSPGAWGWICNSYDAKQPSAQLWMDTTGKWYFCGSGVAYHAGTGRVAGDWNTTVGLETDHTKDEIYPPGMLSSIQRGFAAICKHEGRNADFITFHKIEAVPRGRKVDPYLRTDGGSADDQSSWDNELAQQRAIIQGIINGGIIPPTGDWFDMATEADLRRIVQEEVAKVTGEVNFLYRNEVIEGQPFSKTAANFNDTRNIQGNVNWLTTNEQFIDEDGNVYQPFSKTAANFNDVRELLGIVKEETPNT